MRTWSYLKPSLSGKHQRLTITDAEILQQYGPKWGFLLGRQSGKTVNPEDITAENCIQDFVKVHMAKMEHHDHDWSGWPGAICLNCGSEDPLEIALADNREDEVLMDMKNHPEKYQCKSTVKVPYGNNR